MISTHHTTLWCQQDAVVLTWIYATISAYLLHQLVNHKSGTTSAMDAWACLRDICQLHNTAMQNKKRRYIHIDQCGGGGVEDDNDAHVDLISGLPDDVLIYILSLAADMKTAGRTSLLSKRWTHVWTHIIKYICISSGSIFSTSFPPILLWCSIIRSYLFT